MSGTDSPIVGAGLDLEFLILGPLCVRSLGVEVPLGGMRQRKMLALLLLNANRTLPVERLVDDLWDDPPQSARQQIHNSIGHLRRTLARVSGGVQIATTAAGYQFNVREDAVDTYQFQVRSSDAVQAAAEGRIDDAVELYLSALELWRGDALVDIDCPAVASAASKLNEQRLVAIENLMSLRLRAGDSSSVVGDLRELVTEHPLRESLRGSLMVALYRSGRHVDALATYDEGRRFLAEELGLEPGPDLRELHAEILSGAVEVGAPAIERTPIPPTVDETPPVQPVAPSLEATTIPSPVQVSGKCFLPPDTREFTGRAAEISRLCDETRQAQPAALVISAIDGMGGVGKTAIAVHLAHRVADDYPDGQYFLDLHGFSSGTRPVAPEQALDTLLRASGLAPERIPANLEERSALWRSQLAGQRAILVLDNASDAAQVRPLLPGTPGVLVIVTSRRKLAALDGAVPVSLDVLSQEDAVALFDQIADTQPGVDEIEDIATVVELCGRLPLAIRIAAARLRDRKGWTVADLIDRLDTHSRRARFLQVDDRNVMAVLKLSYRYLSKQTQQIFRLLSLHPGSDFDAYSTAALTGVSFDDAEYCLEMLFELNLLRQDTVGRFYYHDLVRDCAFKLLTEAGAADEWDEARQSLFDYYIHSAYSWCSHFGDGAYLMTHFSDGVYLMTPHGFPAPRNLREVSSHQDAARALASEYSNLVAVCKFAAANGYDSHAWQLICILQPYLKLSGYGDIAFSLFQDGLQSARAADDKCGQSACLHGLAIACLERRSNAEAQELLQQAIKLSRELGDRVREMAQLVSLGVAYFNDDRLDEAQSTLLAAEAMADCSAVQSLRVRVLNNLGVVCRDLGRIDESLDYLHRAAAESAAENGSRIQPLIVWNIGLAFHLQGNHQLAIEQFELAYGVSVLANYRFGEVLALIGLCTARRSQGDLVAAIDHGRLALIISREFGLRILECESLCALGEVAVSMESLDTAEREFKQAAERANRYQYPRYVARAMEGLAHVASARGLLDDSQKYWEEAVHMYPEGMADVEFARLHLASLDDRTTRCFRCEIVSSPNAG
ncbi:BTAD domain-containing putative transcriptional regulator [Nocardia suismassiliense]|uniref:BTAD domain-containing putative transcriptional regulator n=1 Tax=Nocardia suismassiliense TaxID=2077092 RepID=A0ABW6QMM2_9NOCA